jgi:FkbH-like protein
MRLSILSDINLDWLGKQLSARTEVYRPDGYGAWVQEIVNPDSGMYRFDPHMVFILLDGEELVRNTPGPDEKITELEKYGDFVETAVKNNPGVMFFVSTIDCPHKEILGIKEVREERRIENAWYEILAKQNRYDNFYIFDLKRLIEENGRRTFYSAKLWYLSGMKYTMKALTTLQGEIERLVKAYEGKRKKCLILDLDNTLWGGVVGEDGIEGIELSEFKEGARFKELQKRVKEMKNQGIVLAAASRNNRHDVREVFQNHPHMILQEEDFVSLKIDWEPKYRNIREIAEELNIGLDSFVFIDDSPVERESIKHQLPEVTVPDFPGDTSRLESFIREVYRDYFLTLECTEEDRKKTDMYRQNVKKVRAMKSAASFEDFLHSLKTEISIWQVKEEDVQRISQLTRKTNQFNLTTRRYTEKDIYGFMESPRHDIYAASVEDKFGDSGTVAVVIVKKVDDRLAELDTFLMSCRVMGKYIEEQIIDYVENQLRSAGFREFGTYYYPTQKNKPAACFFDKLGYALIETDAGHRKHYSLELEKKPERNSYAQLTRL